MTAPTLPPAVRSLGARLRPRRPLTGRLQTGPAWLLGLAAGLWAAAIGLALAVLPLLLTWMASPDSGLTWTEALRLGGLLWVVAHGVPVTVAGVTISLLPWGLAVVPLLLLGYGGGWAARRSGAAVAADLGWLVGAGTVAYAAIVGVVAGLTAEPASRTSVLDAVLRGALIALLGLGGGALRAAGVRPLDRLPSAVAVALRAGAVAAVAMLGLGAVAATVSLLAHFDTALTMAQSLGAGVGGGLALAALGLAYVPVMAVWGAAYAMGAGVVLAPAITVTPFISALPPTELPPFPLLAALPPGSSTLAWLLPLTGVLAGVLAGLVIGRRARSESRLTRLAMAGGAAAVAGGLLALAALLASGGLGTERLALLGPVPATVGILGAVLIVLGAVPSAVAPSGPERPSLIVAPVGDAVEEAAAGAATGDTAVDHERVDSAPDAAPERALD